MRRVLLLCGLLVLGAMLSGCGACGEGPRHFYAPWDTPRPSSCSVEAAH